MDLAKELIEFLQIYPELYAIIKSPLFMQIVEAISARLTTFSDLQQKFSNIEADDLELILNSLASLKLISKAKGTSENYYSITEKGNILLDKYAKIKKDLLIEGKDLEDLME